MLKMLIKFILYLKIDRVFRAKRIFSKINLFNLSMNCIRNAKAIDFSMNKIMLELNAKMRLQLTF